MNISQIEQMIVKRKSVRSISESPLTEKDLNMILSFTQNASPLFPAIRTSIRLLTRAEIQTFTSVFAPHYLAVYSETSSDSQLNVGFILQQTDLYISSLGLGSCWLGMTKPKQTDYDGLTFVILLAFGKPEEDVHRISVNQFKRKSLAEISSPGAIPSYIEAVRLAPSAMNKQPWYFTGEDRSCRIFSVRGKGLINIAEGWRFVDLGIAMAHLSISAKASGNSVLFKREDSIPFRCGSEYILSCKVE